MVWVPGRQDTEKCQPFLSYPLLLSTHLLNSVASSFSSVGKQLSGSCNRQRRRGRGDREEGRKGGNDMKDNNMNKVGRRK